MGLDYFDPEFFGLGFSIAFLSYIFIFFVLHGILKTTRDITG